MASVMLGELVAASRVRPRLNHAVPAGDRRSRRAVEALRSSVVGATWPVPSLAASGVLHVEKKPRPIVHEGTPSRLMPVAAGAGQVTARHPFPPSGIGGTSRSPDLQARQCA
jgi:hypothetical protein